MILLGQFNSTIDPSRVMSDDEILIDIGIKISSWLWPVTVFFINFYFLQPLLLLYCYINKTSK